ncbi:AzlC family ABC transporter permease [Saxibacter everestensis]|uniref:AzlC family ABC transporter permease n=1 Tax=Saxibacter everestensis TaxID=2909229 RepID=A0ABY8QYQ9_9MICO|nr:AzlC family ABC transporter permease [Brevibacteriaceae bacterium ZFBP1038]
MSSLWRTLDGRLRRDIALVCLADALVGVSYGAIAVDAGFEFWLVLALSVLVLAGSAEFLFVGLIAAGGSPIAAMFAGLLVNARHLPFGLAVHDVIGRGWRRVLGSHLMNDESVVFALGERMFESKRAAYWACGLGILICWPVGAMIGAFVGGIVGDTDAYGLDAMFPAVLLALIFPSLRNRSTRRVALFGGVIALLATPVLPAGLPVLLALFGLVFRKKRAAE